MLTYYGIKKEEEHLMKMRSFSSVPKVTVNCLNIICKWESFYVNDTMRENGKPENTHTPKTKTYKNTTHANQQAHTHVTTTTKTTYKRNTTQTRPKKRANK